MSHAIAQSSRSDALVTESGLAARQTLYDGLMARARGDANDEDIACILSSWACGQTTALPRWMGLEPHEFREMVSYHFGDLDAVAKVTEKLMQGDGLGIEWDDIFRLLLEARANESPSEYWLAKILSVACLARAHLWEDLGLWSRPTLTTLIARNFPPLAAQNSKNMRWKKFLFKKLCDEGGRYLCRAPSCDECNEREFCFAPK